MYSERTLLNDLRHRFQHGGMTTRLIFINVGVYLIIRFIEVLAFLFNQGNNTELSHVLTVFFTLDSDFSSFLRHPWGLITSIFSHFSLWHLVMNMLFLYFSGQLFESLFPQKRLWHTYVLGGIAGCFFELIAHLVFPLLQEQHSIIVGASGSIMAIFTSLAFYRPNIRVNLFGVFPVRLIFLAGFFILTDILSLGIKDGTAHFAHLGGIVFGAVAVQKMHSRFNIMNLFEEFGSKINHFLKRIFNVEKSLRIQKGGKDAKVRFKSDEAYNLEARLRQEKTDAILDKISKSGYESLTKSEKEFLFNQSKNG